MKKAVFTAMATGIFFSALAVNSSATILFEDDFSSGDLSSWNYVVYGEVVHSPTDSGNNVLSFSDINSGGDTFSSLIENTGAATYTLSFDYYTTDGTDVRNGGGFAGIDDDGVKGNDHIWYLGTPEYLSVTYLPQATDGWKNVSYTFSLPDTWTSFSLMFEDFRAPARDAFFDNIVLSDSNGVSDGNPAPVPEPATVFLFGVGLSALAGAQLRRRK